MRPASDSLVAWWVTKPGRDALAETRLRLRSWWLRHWPPARIRQLTRERNDWRRWLIEREQTLAELREGDAPNQPTRRESSAWWLTEPVRSIYESEQ